MRVRSCSGSRSGEIASSPRKTCVSPTVSSNNSSVPWPTTRLSNAAAGRSGFDLHDDIGARLLTLIYKAQSPEMEEYARRTLQDLKTLTRGLAAANHRLSHASSEWKADLAHRLNAASIEFDWSCEFDADLVLSVVQWSAITRILRELVSNVIAHSSASRVEVSIRVEADAMHLSVVDNGSGREPKLWSHGLGLGGVRKRAKQLGGHVEWVQLAPRGICCRVTVLELSRTR
jgi:signal transduction histidine kinase